MTSDSVNTYGEDFDASLDQTVGLTPAQREALDTVDKAHRTPDVEQPGPRSG